MYYTSVRARIVRECTVIIQHASASAAAMCIYILLLLRVLLLAAAVRHCIPATQGVLHTAALVTVNDIFISGKFLTAHA